MRLTRISLSCHGFAGFKATSPAYPRTREFNIQQHWLNESYRISLPKFEKGAFWHACVSLYPMPGMEPRIERAADEVIWYKRPFDFDAYFSLPERQRKMLSLETLHDGLLTRLSHFAPDFGNFPDFFGLGCKPMRFCLSKPLW